jgi:uncharacterized protein
MTTPIDHWADRVDGGDWDRITEELNEYGGALLPRLLTPEEAARIACPISRSDPATLGARR